MKRERIEKLLVRKCKESYQDFLRFKWWALDEKDLEKKKMFQDVSNSNHGRYLDIVVFLEEAKRPISERTFTRWYREVRGEVYGEKKNV